MEIKIKIEEDTYDSKEEDMILKLSEGEIISLIIKINNIEYFANIDELEAGISALKKRVKELNSQ